MSFDKSCKPTENIAVHKYPIRRLELSIIKFLKVLEIDIDRLYRHKLNIEKFIVQEEWPGLHKEQVNASRTVQQIKANIREIEKARSQTIEEDLPIFDAKIEGMRESAIQAIQNFTLGPVKTISGCDISPGHSISSHEDDSASINSPASSGSQQIQLHIAPVQSEAAASWESLQENLMELNDLIHDFAEMVECQGEKINTIEDNIDTAQNDVKQGTLSLGKAAKYKAAILPVAGAVLGGAIAGPIGFIAGAKIAGVVGLVGGFTGYFSGNALKKRQDKIGEMELSNLSENDTQVSTATTDNQRSTLNDMMPWNWRSERSTSESSNNT